MELASELWEKAHLRNFKPKNPGGSTYQPNKLRQLPKTSITHQAPHLELVVRLITLHREKSLTKETKNSLRTN